MHCLSKTLQSVLNRNDLTAADVARKSNLHQSFLSRLLSGKDFTVTKANFHRLLDAFPNKEDKADLVAAHLEDERSGPGSDLVKIFVERGSALVSITPPAEPSFESLLDDLKRLSLRVPSLKVVLTGLHDLVVKSSLQEGATIKEAIKCAIREAAINQRVPHLRDEHWGLQDLVIENATATTGPNTRETIGEFLRCNTRVTGSLCGWAFVANPIPGK
jgi:transcriptional regulator with XRE-family HTH domain